MRAISLLFLLLPAVAAAQDAERGRLLYQTYCGGCHYERVHDRLRTEASAAIVRAAQGKRLIQESIAFVYADGGEDWLDEDAEAKSSRFGRRR